LTPATITTAKYKIYNAPDILKMGKLS